MILEEGNPRVTKAENASGMNEQKSKQHLSLVGFSRLREEKKEIQMNKATIENGRISERRWSCR